MYIQDNVILIVFLNKN
ncbi:hypothetical protein [Escherichia coli]